MATSAEQMRAHRGPAILTGGFRPFFLAGAAWAAFAILIWMPLFEGHFSLPSTFSSLEWHVHELLWGYLAAAVAGFLLTAMPNWTGRLPVVGRPLAALALLWAAGRLAVFFSGVIGAGLAAVIDVGFLVAVLGLGLRETIAGRHWRSLRVLALVALLAIGNVVFHAEAILFGATDFGPRIGIATAVLFVALIGGRLVPSFTANWLRPRGPGGMPIPFGRFDGVVMAVTVVTLTAWVARPDARATAIALLVAGLAQTARLVRWVGWRTGGEALVWVLHAAYLFVPLGFLLIAASHLGLPLLTTAALHAWTVGAIGLMTLAVMTRASLGHTGRALAAGRGQKLIYFGLLAAVVARLAAGLGSAELLLLHLAVAGWLVAFVGFVVVYAPILTRPRA